MKNQLQYTESKTAYGNEHKQVLVVVAGLLGFGCVCASPAMLSTGGDTTWYTNSVFAGLLWLMASYIFYCLCKKGFCKGKKKWVLPGIFSALFSLCMVFGAQLESKGSVAFTDGSMWLCILVLSVCFAVPVRVLWEWMPEKRRQHNNHKGFFMTAIAIFICYVPVFLAVYPGFFVYDAQDELMQVITRSFSTHHPLLHVLGMGGIIQLVYKVTGSYNFGIACYTLFQMTVLSGIFAYVICRLRAEGMKKNAGIAMALYFGLFPTVVMFSLCSAKDGLFTGMVLLVVLLLRELVQKSTQFFDKKAHVVLLIFSAVGMSLLRHNGFYAFLVFFFLVAVTMKMTGLCTVWKKVAFVAVTVLAGYILLNTALTVVVSADDSENQELLTVPIMQMARVYAYEQDSLTAKQKETLHEILPHEALMRYTPKVSDGVKIDFNNETYSRNPAKYLKLWAEIGTEHPFAYLNAWFMTSYGFWYSDAVIDVYRGNNVFTFTYGDSSYFGFETERPGVRQSRLPLLEKAYKRLSLELTQQRVPGLSMLFSPGFLFWVMMLVLGGFAYRKQWKKLFPYSLPVLLWLTVILGPTYLVRYVLFLWVILPMLLWDAFSIFDN